VRIAIVNDEPVAAAALRQVLVTAGGYTVAWVARDGAEAVRRCVEDRPDVVLMDLVMPEMDGVEATRRIMATAPCAILLVTSDVTRTSNIFAAMGAGALDVVATPILAGAQAESTTRALLAKVRLVGQLATVRHTPALPMPALATGRSARALVAIGASAGGPPAVAHVLRDLSSDLPIAVVVVQHVDQAFADSMAEWLDSQTQLKVSVARPEMRLEAGRVYLAGGEGHLVLTAAGALDYVSEPRDSLYRPSADMLFTSVAAYWRGPMAGVVLTGMGHDGAAGLGRMRAAGARTVAQDQATSAVYGMPRAAAEANAATDVLPLARIGPFLHDHLKGALSGAAPKAVDARTPTRNR
jgi:two-component system response regulator WspF